MRLLQGGVVEHVLHDEQHVVLECSAYDSLRNSCKWMHLFSVKWTSLKDFLNQDAQYDVAVFPFVLKKVMKKVSVFGTLGCLDMFCDEAIQ